ncbi:MAG: NTP transferase domain-containing protein, partial [Actinobacteria bacterium]|nr:NTP transferase domain-containing protein [Actinomycetota bacterium]
MPRPTRAPATPTPFAAVILAGGASRRMGRDKRLLPWDRDAGGRPRTLLRSIVERLSAIASEVVVVANDRPDAGPATLVPDLYPGAGSLGGIFSGITAA